MAPITTSARSILRCGAVVPYQVVVAGRDVEAVPEVSVEAVDAHGYFPLIDQSLQCFKHAFSGKRRCGASWVQGISLMVPLGNLCERSLLRSPSLQHTLLHLAVYKRGILLIYLLPLFDINQIIAINREILLLS